MRRLLLAGSLRPLRRLDFAVVRPWAPWSSCGRGPALRARVLSLYMVALGTIYPIGAVVQGTLGDRLGLRAVTTGRALLFLAVIMVVGLWRPDLVAAYDDPVPAGLENVP